MIYTIFLGGGGGGGKGVKGVVEMFSYHSAFPLKMF